MHKAGFLKIIEGPLGTVDAGCFTGQRSFLSQCRRFKQGANMNSPQYVYD